jgi:predicted small lipoprotein YifL
MKASRVGACLAAIATVAGCSTASTLTPGQRGPVYFAHSFVAPDGKQSQKA